MGLYTHCGLGLLLVGLLLRGAEADCCHMEWLPSRGYCCKLFGDELSWADAELACQNRTPSSHLASILSNAESAELAKYIVKYRKDDGHVWIGLCAPPQNRVRRGADSPSPSYMAWKDGEPNNQRNEENYVELSSPSGDGKDQPADRTVCPHGGLSYKSHCYEFFQSSGSWESTEDECLRQRYGAQLASILTAPEERAISDYIRPLSEANDVWIGLHATPTIKELIWEWSDGSAYVSGSALWDNRRPDTSVSSFECISLTNVQNPTLAIRWVQRPCTDTLPYVCKYNSTMLGF